MTTRDSAPRACSSSGSAPRTRLVDLGERDVDGDPVTRLAGEVGARCHPTWSGRSETARSASLAGTTPRSAPRAAPRRRRRRRGRRPSTTATGSFDDGDRAAWERETGGGEAPAAEHGSLGQRDGCGETAHRPQDRGERRTGFRRSRPPTRRCRPRGSRPRRAPPTSAPTSPRARHVRSPRRCRRRRAGARSSRRAVDRRRRSSPHSRSAVRPFAATERSTSLVPPRMVNDGWVSGGVDEQACRRSIRPAMFGASST